MSTLEDLNTGPGGLVGMIGSLSQRFRPLSRRSLLVGTAVAGSALATNPRTYALRPVTAYASICGPGNTFDSGWTVFCCTINKGVNACPPGSFAAGWWKAADSSWCGAGYRYIVDCNASCSKCSTGCGDGICDSRCWSCSCGRGSSATCDQRRVCCNAFRYGQCNTQVKCSGGVHCRVVSCVAPYKWASCTTTSLSDNRTAEHSAPCLPRWGVIEQKYRDMGAQRSFLKASTGPVRGVGDGKGTYVQYQGGKIVSSSAHGTRAVSWWVDDKWQAMGGPRGVMGYPASDVITGLKGNGWIQIFANGAVTDSALTTTQVLYDVMWRTWQSLGRENGPMGYPISGVRRGLRDGGWIQLFQNGAIADSVSTHTQAVYDVMWSKWQESGRENGSLGYPTSAVQRGLPDGGWIQTFQTGAVTDSSSTHTQIVAGAMYDAWWISGRWLGPLHYPTAAAVVTDRGAFQTFQRGEIWALSGQKGYYVFGNVMQEWKAAGGASGRYGYPLTRTLSAGGGRYTCTFEGGTITA